MKKIERDIFLFFRTLKPLFSNEKVFKKKLNLNLTKALPDLSYMVCRSWTLPLYSIFLPRLPTEASQRLLLNLLFDGIEDIALENTGWVMLVYLFFLGGQKLTIA